MREAIKDLYIVLYSCVLIFAFAIIPFACFYYEAYDPEANTTCLKRFWDGFKYTIGLIVIVIVLFVVGLFLNSPNQFNGNDPPDVWARKLLFVDGKAMATLSFTVACITVIGYVSWCTYTAFGLAAFPIQLMKGSKSIKEEASDIERKRKERRSKREHEEIDSNNDRKNLLTNEERALAKRASRLEQMNTGCRKCLIVLRPFSVIFGALFMLLSVLIVISFALAAIDKTLNHIDCGVTCGFILKQAAFWNPLDQVFLALAGVFPVDYVIISLIILFIYYSTLRAITTIGIRFFCLKMFVFRKQRTAPQAILIAAIILMLSILALNNAIITLAPTYAMFGSQTYFDNSTDPGKEIPCSINAPDNTTCTTTQIGVIVNGININIGFFGIIFYGFTWLFVLAFFISVVVAGCMAKSSNIEEYSDDDEEDEN
eukprot:TRINITY_DN3668_c0_g1_i1.p1 TRINITY_DN3668_c0_g1~~TRINITY_DN3668_c0_g1_i1.p1  ORF type:complete len:501 (+),score=85.60 TRINITY_DN3668_c0_g1_i1:222-1505(+)